MRCALLVIGVILAAVSSGAARPDPPATQPALDVPALIKQLDSDNVQRRDSAQKALLRAGPDDLKTIKAALAGKPSPEVAQRLRMVLELLDGGGQAVHGLKLNLESDRTAAKLDDTVALTVTLCNVTDKPIRVFVGDGGMNNTNIFACGGALRRVRGEGEKPAAGSLVKGNTIDFSSAPMARAAQVVTIEPLTVQKYECDLTLAQDAGKVFWRSRSHQVATMLPLAGDGKCRLRMLLEVGAGDDEHEWKGEVSSNDVVIDTGSGVATQPAR